VSQSALHRLLVGQGRYIILEKQFPELADLRDWLAVNTLLPDHSISVLLSIGEITFGQGKNEEWFKYFPPRMSDGS